MNVSNPHTTRRSSLFLMVLLLLLTACGNANKSKQTDRQEHPIAAEQSVESDISFKNQAGEIVTLPSLKGKVVFINFWATWCPPCIHEMPSINTLHSAFKDQEDIEFMMVDVDNNIAASTAFMQENNYDLPVYVPASNISSDYLNGAIPTTVILDKNGRIEQRMEGGRDYTDPEIAEKLKELLDQ